MNKITIEKPVDSILWGGDIFLDKTGKAYRLTSHNGEWAAASLQGQGSWSGWKDNARDAVQGLTPAPIGTKITLEVVE